MIDAISRFQPNSNWITAGLLTVFVVSFALVAQGHVKEDVRLIAKADASVLEFCNTKVNTKRLLRY